MINLNQALYEKRNIKKRQYKVILLHDNAPSHTAKLVKEMIEAFGWEILSLAAYSPDLLRPLLPLVCIDGTRTCSAALHFLRRCTKMARFGCSKEQQFFWHGIHKQVEKIYI